jgi:hypothetical protein
MMAAVIMDKTMEKIEGADRPKYAIADEGNGHELGGMDGKRLF